jgi:gliding motility-associated-like protein
MKNSLTKIVSPKEIRISQIRSAGKRFFFLSFFFFSMVMDFNGRSQIGFAPQLIYKAGTSPEVVCIGDVNNDGLNDVVVGTDFYFDEITDFKIFVFIQDSSGNLISPKIYSYPKVYPGLSCLLIKDLNNDNLNDVVVAYSDSIGIFYQNNTGILNPIQSFYSGDNSNSVDGISAGDLNNDGLTDLAVSHWAAVVISVFYQKSSGGFTIQNYPAPAGGYDQIEVADLNNDHLDDVVLMSGGNYNQGIHIYAQNNSGVLDTYVSYYHPDLTCVLDCIAVDDINNDKINDIVEVSWAGDPFSQLALRPQNQTSHLFDTLIQISSYTNPDVVKIGDLNCDGINEIIIAHGGWSSLTIFEQDKNNIYKDYTLFNMFTNSHINHHGLSIGDINNDGKKDIVTVCDNYGLMVLLNQSINNEFVVKPQIPAGENRICFDGQHTSYKTIAAEGDKVQWNLYPPEAGEIIFSNDDSCQILWNDSWRGAGGIYVTAANSCGSKNSDTLFINKSLLPMINLGNDTTLCENSTLSIRAGSGFTSYQWQDNSTDSIFLVTRGGTYFVQAGNICGTRYDTILVTEVSLPEIDLKDTILCSGDFIQVDISQPGFSKYRWQDNTTDPVYVIRSPGTYTVEITDSNNCSNIQSISVDEVVAPSLQWPSDTTVCSQNIFTLQAETYGSSYLWQDGTTQPQHLVTESGDYSVSVTNHCGSTQATITVHVEECISYLDVPSAFSPNGDGLNDIIYPVGLYVEQVNLLIFNRWGQKVFESNDMTKGWDGTCKGKMLEPGVFVYTVSAISTIDGHAVQKQGNISLIR